MRKIIGQSNERILKVRRFKIKIRLNRTKSLNWQRS